MEIENIRWKKWFLIFHVCPFENRKWFVSLLTNHSTDRKYQFDATPDDMCGRMGVYLGKNNLSIYFFQYIEYIDVFLSIYQTQIYSFWFAITTCNACAHMRNKPRQWGLAALVQHSSSSLSTPAVPCWALQKMFSHLPRMLKDTFIQTNLHIISSITCPTVYGQKSGQSVLPFGLCVCNGLPACLRRWIRSQRIKTRHLILG